MSDYMIKKLPAVDWQEALPLGNGTVGAMIYGNIQKERILINHERLFRYQKEPIYDPFNKHLNDVRKLMLDGKYDEGEKYFNEKFKECCKEVYNVDPYQPFAELSIFRKPDDAFADYKAVLDFQSAIATVSWMEKNTKIVRESFVSYDTGCICTSMYSSNELPLSIKVNINSVVGGDEYMNSKCEIENDCLIYKAKYKDGKEHGAVVFVKTTGGSVEFGKDSIIIEKAKIINMYTMLYIYEDADKAVNRLIKQIKKYEYNQLKKKHISIWKKLYGSTNLNLYSGNKNLSNEEYLLKAYNDEKPLNLFHTMFNYGKYLFISSSRKNGLPVNLQGIWNGTYNPKWDSDIHNDENVQMCYWASLALGQFDSSMALYDYFDSLIPHFRENAKKIYGCRGILVPICMSTHGKISGVTGRWQSWISAGGWLSSHYYDYWLYTKDDDFLKHRAVRFMKEVVLFYEDFLITGEDGKYIFVPSLSPENVPNVEHASMMCVNATMDIAVAKQSLTNLITACRYLDIEQENLARWEAMLDKMPDYEVNEDGAMKEWLYDDIKDNYYHRHQSHIYPLFPGFEITKENNEKIYNAIKTAVDKRLTIGFVQQTGWSYAHMANIYARLEDKENAYACLNYILRACTGSNLFTYHNDWRDQGLTVYWFGQHPPFQIDANLGFTAAVLEMLLFSKPGFLRILPALPDQWKKGRIKGINTRTRTKCDISWDKSDIDITIISLEDQKITIQLPVIPNSINSTCKNIELTNTDLQNNYSYYSVELKKDEKCIITVK